MSEQDIREEIEYIEESIAFAAPPMQATYRKQLADAKERLRLAICERETATTISDYLHTLEVAQPLEWHMARGLSIKLAALIQGNKGQGN